MNTAVDSFDSNAASEGFAAHANFISQSMPVDHVLTRSLSNSLKLENSDLNSILDNFGLDIPMSMGDSPRNLVRGNSGSIFPHRPTLDYVDE